MMVIIASYDQYLKNMFVISDLITVDPQLSEHLRTEGCSDILNVQIFEISHFVCGC